MKFIHIISIVLFMTLVIQCTPKVADLPKQDPPMTDVPATVDPNNDFRRAAPEAGPAPKIEMGSYEDFELENGLKVIVVENHKLPRVSLQLFVDAPVINENEYAGYVDMAGDLLSKGTKTRSKADIDEAVDFLGANLSSGSSGLYGSSLTKHLNPLLEIMSDVLLNPSFPEAEFEKMKKQTLSALAQAKEDPNSIAANVAQVLRYGADHPYGEIPTEETIEKIEIEKCRNYYNTYFKPNISYLVVVGDISLEEIKPLAAKYFGSWKRDANIPKAEHKMPKPPEATQLDFVNKNGAVQSVINVTYPIALTPGSADAIPASVMNTMLGGFFNSRLMQNLRETYGYTYGARSNISSDELVGYFNAGASVRNEVTDSAIVQLMKELKDIRDQKLSKADLELVKNVMAGNFARSMESPQTIARFALNTFRYKLPKDYYATYLKRLSNVTADDVQAMAKKYIKPGQAHILVVGNKDEVAEKLGQFSADGKVKYYDVYGNKIEMQEVDLSGEVTVETVLDKYVKAIGGAGKLKAVKDMHQVFTGEVQGMMINNEMYLKRPNKFAMTSSMNGMVMMKRVFDGTKAKDSGMNGDRMLEGKELENMKANAQMFSELNYKETGTTAELKGVDRVNGENAYKVEFMHSGGNKTVEYYSVESGLKIRSEITEGSGAEASTQAIDWGNYKEVDGVLLPHSMSISGGGMPMTIKLKAMSIQLNKGVEDKVFMIE